MVVVVVVVVAVVVVVVVVVVAAVRGGWVRLTEVAVARPINSLDAGRCVGSSPGSPSLILTLTNRAASIAQGAALGALA